jgi:hypothetical protein
MPDTGAPWNIPYVDPSDIVRDYPAADEAQALAIAAGLSLAGGLVEVKTVVKTDTQSSSVSAGGNVAVSDLTIAHSIADATHKVLLFGYVSGSQDTVFAISGALTAGGTELNLGESAGSRTRTATQNAAGATGRMSSITLIASYAPPSTASITYGVNIYNGDSTTRNLYINRSSADSDSTGLMRGSSLLLLAEVKV